MNRYFMSLSGGHSKDLIKQKEFMSSNSVISNREQLDISPYKRSFSKQDLARLVSSGILARDEPMSLLRKVYLDLMVHFGLKGREAVRDLRRDSFLFRTDEHGFKYYCLNLEECSSGKKYSEMNDWFWESRMYEEPSSDHCPVRSLSLYFSQLDPTCATLLQRPIERFVVSQCKFSGPYGSGSIARLMQEISQDAKLSTMYFASSVKTTVIHMLDKEALDLDPVTKMAMYRITKGGYDDMPVRMTSEILRSCSHAFHSMFYKQT